MEDKFRAPELPASAAPGAPTNTASVRVISTLTQINLSPPVDAIKLAELRGYLIKLSNDCSTNVDRYNYIREDALDAIEFMLNSSDIADSAQHRTWSDERFFTYLSTLYQPSAKSVSFTLESFLERFRETKMDFDVTKGVESLSNYASILKDLHRKMISFDLKFEGEVEEKLISSILDKWPRTTINTRLKSKLLLVANGQPKSVTEYLGALGKAASLLSTTYWDAHSMGMEFKTPPERAAPHAHKRRGDVSSHDSSSRKKKHTTSSRPSSTDVPSPSICGGCGHSGHSREECRYASHPDFNHDVTATFIQSTKGKAWKATHNLDHLSRNADSLDGSLKALPPRQPKGGRSGRGGSHASLGRGGRGGAHRGELVAVTHSRAVISDTPLIDALISVGDTSRHVTALLDTCAFQASYISQELAAWFSSHGLSSCPCKAEVCDFSGTCRHVSTCFTFQLSLINEDLNTLIPIDIKSARVVSMPHDLIIGLPNIRKYKLLEYYAYKFTELSSSPPDRSPPGGDEGSGLRDPAIFVPSAVSPWTESEKAPKKTLFLKSDFLSPDPEAHDLVEERRSGQSWDTDYLPESQTAAALRIEGSDNFCVSMRQLAQEYSDIFLSDLTPSSVAKLPAMELAVNEAKWQVATNATAPRLQSLVKEEAIRIQTQKLLSSERIELCSEAYYSQVHMAKPPGKDKYRFCIDYRNLNNATEPIYWPLPVINNMLRRLGTRRPICFATMDMTSGYHQIPVHENSRRFTAFITFLGVFQWLCVPFGLKGAPAYFQKNHFHISIEWSHVHHS